MNFSEREEFMMKVREVPIKFKFDEIEKCVGNVKGMVNGYVEIKENNCVP